MHKLSRIISILILPSLLFSCTKGKTNQPLVVGILNPPLSLQAWKIRDGASTLIGNQIHRGLLRLDSSTGNIVGAAATSWTYLQESNEIRFNLDPEIRFHDGTALTCDWVKRSFERLRSSEGNTSAALPEGTTFRCQDNITFIIKTPFIPAKFLDLLASPSMAIVKDDGIVGLGPYALVNQSEHEVNLKRASGKGPAAIRFVISDHLDLIKRFKAGEIDDLLYLGLFMNLSLDCQRITGLSPTSFWFGINAKSWGFSDKQLRLRVQRLLKLAVQKSNVFSNEIPNASLIPFGISGNRLPAGFDIDMELVEARSALTNSVSKYGKIHLALRDVQRESYEWNKLLTALDPDQKIFAPEFLTNADFFKAYYKGQLNLYFVGANVSRDDPSEVLSYFRKQDFVNQSGVSEQVVDEILHRMAKATSSNDVRQLAQQADEWIISQGYAVPLFSKRFNGCIQHRLKGYRMSPLGPLSLDYSQVEL